MNGWQVSSRLHLALVVALVGSSIGLLALPVRAEEEVDELSSEAVAELRREGPEELTGEKVQSEKSENNSTSIPAFWAQQEVEKLRSQAAAELIREPVEELKAEKVLSQKSEDNSTSIPASPSTPSLVSELDRPATTVREWISQIEASGVQITLVRVEETENGLQVVLETEGKLPVPTTQTIGNTLIADIPFARIAENFVQVQPKAGIARVEVTGLEGDRVRVAITGTNAPPVAVVTSEAQGLAFAVRVGTVAAEDKEEIEIVVTGQRAQGYNPPSASTATRTDTPLRDIPQSIQVVPQQVLEDRNVRTLNQAVETVSGVSSSGSVFNAPAGGYIIRGFDQGGNFRNGYRDVDRYSLTGVETIERVEVLKGPASVLFGAVEPGGIINVITRQPLSEPYYNVAFEAGNFGFYQPSLDFSGPLNADKTLLYRFIASYQHSNSFQEFTTSNLTTIAPSITLRLGDRTNLNLYYEYIKFNGVPESFTTVFSDNTFRLPRSRYLSYPLGVNEYTAQRYGYILSHEFNDNWQIRNNFSVADNSADEEYTVGLNLVDDRFLEQYAARRNYSRDNYFGQIDLLGEVNTGSIAHQLLLGFDFNRVVEDFNSRRLTVPALDVFNPNYDISESEIVPSSSVNRSAGSTQSYGVYLQDQIAFLDNLKLLIGGRYDGISTESGTPGDGVDSEVQNDGAFSPRIGLVYQPSDSVSLYASYSRSFSPTSGFNPDGEALKPTRGTQYEVGVKADFLEDRLSSTLAVYNLTRSNITTIDPNNPDFSLQVGEQRSRGIELDIAGRILPGWNVTAAYAYTNAEITEDNSFSVGNRLEDVPENQASLWTTYQIQEGDLRGLGFGLGLFYVGERQGDLENSYTMPGYFRTDATLYYRRGSFNAAINIRNLFDTVYYSSSDGLRTFVRTGTPFTIIGSIGWEF